MDGLQWKTLLKWMIWRYPYFWKHPNDFQLLFFGDAPPQTLIFNGICGGSSMDLHLSHTKTLIFRSLFKIGRRFSKDAEKVVWKKDDMKGSPQLKVLLQKIRSN